VVVEDVDDVALMHRVFQSVSDLVTGLVYACRPPPAMRVLHPPTRP